LRGFPYREKSNLSPLRAYFTTGRVLPMIGSSVYGQTKSSDLYILQVMKGSVQSPNTCFLDIENFAGARYRGKNSQFFRLADVSNDHFIRNRSDEKTKTGSPMVFQTPRHCCVNVFCTLQVLFVSAISWSIQSWTRSFISWSVIP